MRNNNNASRGGIGFCGCLAIAFIVLKLTNVIDWSWAAVLSPVWVPLVVVILLVGVLAIIDRRGK